VVDLLTLIQVDLNHLECADSEDDPRYPVLDWLIPLLPKVNGRPYLAVFVLTHPDQDHCRGFGELLKRVTIGELWFSPRIFREYHRKLSDDASAFKREAERRVKRVIANAGLVSGGDRVRLVGYDELLKEDEFKGFPRSLLTVPGNALTIVDGKDRPDVFRAFIHAPFKNDAEGERNDTSIAMQVTLKDLSKGFSGYLLLLGDHCYPRLDLIFSRSDSDDLRYNVMLSPHHCSKGAMYWDDGDNLHQDILDAMTDAAEPFAHIISSSPPIPGKDKFGANPPHRKAKVCYETVVNSGHFLCTGEHGGVEEPEAIQFNLGFTGFEHVQPEKKPVKALTAMQAIEQARGGQRPPTERVGFGKNR